MKAIYDAHTTYDDLRPFLQSDEGGDDVFARFKIEK